MKRGLSLLAGVCCVLLGAGCASRTAPLTVTVVREPPSLGMEVIVPAAENPDRLWPVLVQGEVVEMPEEDYLTGVLAGEMPASYPVEALKAQAVAAPYLCAVSCGKRAPYRGSLGLRRLRSLSGL